MDDDFTDIAENALILRRLDQLDEKLQELVEAKRQLEEFAKGLQGMGPLAMMGALKGFNLNGG